MQKPNLKVWPWGLRYGLATVSVTAAIAMALLLEHYSFRGVEFPLFLFAIAVTVWYGGNGAGVVAVVASSMAFNYFFTEPRYSFYVTRMDLPYYAVFVLFASLLAWFSSIRRRAEQQLQKEVAERTQQANLLNLTHDTIFVRDMSDVITYWNRGAEELYGWTADQAIGKDSQQLLQAELPLPLEDVRAELLRTGRWEGELRKIKADGASVVVASRWSLGQDEAGRPLAILETNNDISERKRREEQIRKLNEALGQRTAELEASNKELEAFAYSVSHDLRAPLRHMVGFTELLKKNVGALLDEKSTRYMKTILESAQKMGMLIDDLLSFSRIGRAETRQTLVSLQYLVQEVLSEMRPETEKRSIAWKIGALPNVYGDRSMLKLVLVNLIANAVKFTRTRREAVIEVGVSERRDSERMEDGVVVFVKDNGVGFDMKYSHKLFGVFQRLHQTSAFEGTGIGLATVQRIIHRHGGKVWAESFVDKGATFFFSVPHS
jgi:PAS domain S-box-containing protein